mgnify:CR=1 FL=1|tara:strand:+ start:108 stop:719 length:612 start_codon:yes stop_codon:yes gene_type:complete
MKRIVLLLLFLIIIESRSETQIKPFGVNLYSENDKLHKLISESGNAKPLPAWFVENMSEVVQVKSSYSEITLNDSKHVIFDSIIHPTNPSVFFNKYHVYTTPDKNQIFGLVAECSYKFNYKEVVKILTRKYGSPQKIKYKDSVERDYYTTWIVLDETTKTEFLIYLNKYYIYYIKNCELILETIENQTSIAKNMILIQEEENF